MEINQLIAGLSEASAYPQGVDKVEVIQTHISVVFLTGEFVYKVKKPVNHGFLDFSTLEKRRHFCEEEVWLNRRLAPMVYRGVVPICQTEQGIRVEGSGVVIEWAVKMEHLPEDASLLERLNREEVDRSLIEKLAARIAEFHRHAESGRRIAEFGRFETVARNARENFEQTKQHIDLTVTRTVFDRVQKRMEVALEQLKPLIEDRTNRGVSRDTHGDLRLEHVYYFPNRRPPSNLIIIDCIEFNERFRYADPVADAAFLVMDLFFRGRRDLARDFITAYFNAMADYEGTALLGLYVGYRAIVRAKVEGLKLFEHEIPAGERDSIIARARAYWLVALSALEMPSQKPCLVMVGGLPGSGKSTLARGLAEQGEFQVIRSDVVRKELAGLDPSSSARGEFNEGIYTPEMTARTYAECLQQARRHLSEGERVVVDAAFGDEKNRGDFVTSASEMGVQTVFLLCRARAEVARQRIEARRGDASDADRSTYNRAVENWQPFGKRTQSVVHEISANGSKEEALTAAMQALREKMLIE